MTAPAAPSAPWLSVVGIGDDGLTSLSPKARAVVEAGELLLGGDRHLEMVPDHPAERLTWARPLDATLDQLEKQRGRRVVVLASGDPMCFGVGELLTRRFGVEEMQILPAPSAFSLVCARLGWSRCEVETLSVHARPIHRLHRHLCPGARLIVLSHDGTTPDAIAEWLRHRGFGPSRIWVFEHLDGAAERQIEGTAEDWQPASFAALNTVAIECAADTDAVVQSMTPGLPDDAFVHDGMLTKREVRAATLARLAPLPGQCLWDVGAGSGAIGIEWLRAIRRGRAIAIERNPGRVAAIGTNAGRLGTPELAVVHGTAPECLADLPPPDAVFIGGGITTPELLPTCWRALRRGGRLVANVVTVEGEQQLLRWHAEYGGELIRLAIARVVPVGPLHGWRPLMPVTQLAMQKP
jgi:precorrin-6Y C5,15-methyltransferase (decarboxylating)